MELQQLWARAVNGRSQRQPSDRGGRVDDGQPRGGRRQPRQRLAWGCRRRLFQSVRRHVGGVSACGRSRGAAAWCKRRHEREPGFGAADRIGHRSGQRRPRRSVRWGQAQRPRGARPRDWNRARIRNTQCEHRVAQRSRLQSDVDGHRAGWGDADGRGRHDHQVPARLRSERRGDTDVARHGGQPGGVHVVPG